MSKKTTTAQPETRPVPSRSGGLVTGTTSPTHEQISKRAYEIYLARGGQHGRHEDDWAQAERELRLGRQ